MKLFSVSQSINNDYDTYSSFIICCETEDEAKNASPRDGEPVNWTDHWGTSSWVKSPKYVTVEYLGEAKEGLERGIICSSFHAG